MKRFLLSFGLVLLLPISAIAQSTGLEFLPVDRYRSIPLAPPLPNINLPASYDLSDRFPPIGDQGNQGSCVGWAVGYALKSFHEKEERKWTSWEPQRLASPSYIYDQLRLGASCDRGMYIADALDLLTREGAVSLDELPYSDASCSFMPSALNRQSASKFRIAAWYRTNPQDLETIKRHIASGIPVVVGMRVDDSFMRLRGKDIWYGFPSSSPSGGHAMVVSGYDDATQTFRLVNSWSTRWGDQGFGTISYDAFRNHVVEAYVTQDIILPDDAEAFEVDRDTPYASDIPHGPKIGPFQLGMTKEQVGNSVTSSFSSTSNGFVGLIKTSQREWRLSLLFDPKHDYLAQMYFQPISRDPRTGFVSELESSRRQYTVEDLRTNQTGLRESDLRCREVHKRNAEIASEAFMGDSMFNTLVSIQTEEILHSQMGKPTNECIETGITVRSEIRKQKSEQPLIGESYSHGWYTVADYGTYLIDFENTSAHHEFVGFLHSVSFRFDGFRLIANQQVETPPLELK